MNMKLIINELIINEYKKAHKNFDYALDTLMNSLDPKHYLDVYNIVSEFKIKDSNYQEVEIGEEVIERIRNEFNKNLIDSSVIELLLWVALLFPEV